MMKISVFFGMVAAAGLATAGVVPRQSSATSCSNAITPLLDSSELACLAPGKLVAMIDDIKTGVQPADLATSVDLWLFDFCAVGSCSNQTLTNVAGNITTSCGTSFDGIPIPSGLASLVQTDFPVIRNLLCLSDKTTGAFCMKETIASINGTIQTSDPAVALTALVDAAFSTACTDCGKAAFQIYNPVFPQLNATEAITATCNTSFASSLDTPALTVEQSAAPGVFTAQKGGAVGRLSVNFVGSFLTGTILLALL